MNKAKKILGILCRILAIGFIAMFSIFNLLAVLLSPWARSLYEVPQIVSLFHKGFDIFFSVVFVYGIYLLIRNNPKYLKLFAYFLPAYYLFFIIYRFFFITHGQFENTDVSNFVLFFIPLGLMFVSFKLDSPTSSAAPLSVVADGPFTPLQYQGFIVRGLANIVDQLLIIAPFGLITAIINPGPDDTETYLSIGVILFFVYLIVSEAMWGQTLGKKLFGIKVMMQDGRNCTVWGAIFRNVFRIVDLIFGGYLLAIIVMTITPKRQRIGDLIAKTVVVKP